jgi:hypothetical protein
MCSELARLMELATLPKFDADTTETVFVVITIVVPFRIVEMISFPDHLPLVVIVRIKIGP